MRNIGLLAGYQTCSYIMVKPGGNGSFSSKFMAIFRLRKIRWTSRWVAMKNVRVICELKNSHSVGDVGKPWLGQLSNMLLVKSRVDGSF